MYISEAPLAHARQQQSRVRRFWAGGALLERKRRRRLRITIHQQERERERAMSRETINQTKSAARRTTADGVCLSKRRNARTIRAAFIRRA
jgi:hypothetical protein